MVGGGPDFFVVEQRQHRQISARFSRKQGVQPGVAAGLVVQSGRADELAVGPALSGRREIVRHEVRAEHVAAVDSGLRGDVVHERARDVPCAPHGVDVALRVQGERSAVLSQMDSQLRHPQDRRVDADQQMGQAVAAVAVVPHRQPTADAQIAVQPRIEPRAAVGLQRHHLPACDHPVGMLFDPQIGAVGMRPDHPKRPLSISGAVPGHHRTRPHHEEFARALPRIGLGKLVVAGRT